MLRSRGLKDQNSGLMYLFHAEALSNTYCSAVVTLINKTCFKLGIIVHITGPRRRSLGLGLV